MKRQPPVGPVTWIQRLRLPLLWLLTLGLAAASLAKDLSAYRLGDVVESAIVAPTALTVPDPAATAAMKTAVTSQTPPVFRYFPGLTNTLDGQFQIAFDTARSNFVSGLQDTFHAAVLDHETITSPDFGYFLTAYNFDHPDLPLPDSLAMDWAYGKDGAMTETKWLGEINAVMQYPIRPDRLPPGLEAGDTVRLVAVNSANEVLDPPALASRGHDLPRSQLANLTQAQQIFRREFASGEDPLLARALAAWVQPNCLPDDALTRAARDGAVRQLVAAEEYTPGQVIAPKGAIIDQRILAAIRQLIQTRAPLPAAAAANPVQPALADPAPPPAAAAPETLQAGNAPDFSGPERNLAIAGALIVAGLVALRQLGGGRRPAPSVPALAATAAAPAPLMHTELAPQVLQVVKQAFVHELAGQRRDLLEAQQAAAAEVVELVQRMDALQFAMQERLRTYEAQIRQLEAELTARKEENRQLIRLKIQMIRQQVDLESSPQRIDLN